MLYITVNGRQIEWHVGEELPAIHSRVVKFQADGDELELILAACRETNIKRTMLAEEELFPGTLPRYDSPIYPPTVLVSPEVAGGLTFSDAALSEIRRIAREVAREEIRDAERRGREYYRHRGKGSV